MPWPLCVRPFVLTLACAPFVVFSYGFVTTHSRLITSCFAFCVYALHCVRPCSCVSVQKRAEAMGAVVQDLKSKVEKIMQGEMDEWALCQVLAKF
jgi:hypothetical protein